jgi:ESCRT-II complex subunit VPS36
MERNAKLPGHQIVTVHLTTHRLLFLNTNAETSKGAASQIQDGLAPPSNLQISLADVRQIEYYMGFIRSSAKITLFLGENPETWTQSVNGDPQAGPSTGSKNESNWDCGVCGFTNSGSRPTPVSTLSQTPRCALCGVVKDLVPSTSRPSTPAPAIQSPIPHSSLRTSHPELNAGGEGFEVPCPRCTFLNRPELKRCEVCDGVLTPRTGNTPSNPREGPNAGIDSPAPRLPVLKPPANEKMATVRISFRKGGEKDVYKRLRTVLTAKAWEKSKVDSTSRKNGIGAGDKARTGFGIGSCRICDVMILCGGS